MIVKKSRLQTLLESIQEESRVYDDHPEEPVKEDPPNNWLRTQEMIKELDEKLNQEKPFTWRGTMSKLDEQLKK